MTDQTPFDIRAWGDPLPYDDDVIGGVPPVAPMVLGESAFAYVGKAYTLPEFAAYVASYDFGLIPPDYVVLHHTAVPTLDQWRLGEIGMTPLQVKVKRLRQLDGIKHYYQHTKGWSAGPHLFVDDLYVYLMTPMADIGIHAAQGNSYRAARKLHYSIGIEVVGDYTHQRWPANVERMVGGAVALLKQRLNTFDYIDGPWAGKVGSHRMYNKPSCPGAAIVPSYYLPVLKREWRNVVAPLPPAGARHFVVKAGAGAYVRQGATRQAPIITTLKAGALWNGTVEKGERVPLSPYGTSDEWVCDAMGRCVWKLLLDEQI